LLIAPDRIQRVQALILRRDRPTVTRTRWMFGYQTLDDMLLA